MRITTAEMSKVLQANLNSKQTLQNILQELTFRTTTTAASLRKKVITALESQQSNSDVEQEKPKQSAPSHHNLACRQCRTSLRIPVSQSTVVYSCPSCQAEFEVLNNGGIIQVTWVEKVKEKPPQDRSAAMSDSLARSLLGVSSSANLSEIKAAWRKTSQQYHPDKHQSLPERLRDAAGLEMQRINEAYRYLERTETRRA